MEPTEAPVPRCVVRRLVFASDSGCPLRCGRRALGVLAIACVALFGAPAAAEQALSPSDAAASNDFGRDLATAGGVALIGAPQAGVAGQAYVYRFDGESWLEEDILEPSDGVASDTFGSNVAVGGDVAAVGRFDFTTDPGSVHVFRRNGSSWVEEQKLFASDSASHDYFGADVAVGDGQILVVAQAAGQVYVFAWDGTTWTEEQIIPAPPGGGFVDLAIDEDAPERVLLGVGSTGSPQSYVFNGTSWVFESSFPDFGGFTLSGAVALDGDLAVFHAVDGLDHGGACVYRYDGSVWQPEGCFSPLDGSPNDYVGFQLDVEGNRVLLRGATSSNQALIYERDASGTWQVVRRLKPPIADAADSNYGVGLGLAADDALVASSFDDTDGDGAGRAWVFDLPFEGALVVPDAPEAGEGLGWGLGCDGTRMIGGAPTNDAMGASAGSAVVFAPGASGFQEEQRLFASDAEAGDQFGVAADIAGALALVGASLEDTGASNAGAAYAYRFDGMSWGSEQKLQLAAPGVGDQFGIAVALDGARAAVGANATDAGATNAGSVTVYRDEAGSLTFEQTLVADDPTFNAFLGTAVALDGDVLVAGAPGLFTNTTMTGAAYVFRRSGVSWSQEQKLGPGDLALGDLFGQAVAVGPNVVAVGAPKHAAGGAARGAVYVYRYDGSSWVAVPKLVASDAMDADLFGYSVGVDGDDILVGMNRDGDSGGPYPSSPVLRFRWNGSSYDEVGRYRNPDGANRRDAFGRTLAVAGNDVCIGAYSDELTAGSAGTLYRFANSAAAGVPLPLVGVVVTGFALLAAGARRLA